MKKPTRHIIADVITNPAFPMLCALLAAKLREGDYEPTPSAAPPEPTPTSTPTVGTIAWALCMVDEGYVVKRADWEDTAIGIEDGKYVNLGPGYSKEYGSRVWVKLGDWCPSIDDVNASDWTTVAPQPTT